MGLGLNFQTGILFQDEKNMLIEEHVLLGKITVIWQQLHHKPKVNYFIMFCL